jgi:hypothetical protein
VDEISKEGFQLEQSRPNPTNGHVQIGFHVPVTGKVILTVFDLDGNVVLQPVREEVSAGRHVVNLDLSSLPRGMYYYELRTNEFSGVKKLVRQ